MSVAGLLVERQGDVLRITFDRPERLNSVTAEILHAAAEAVENADDSGARVIVLTGSGRAFSSGADVSPDGSPPGLDTLDAANRLVLAIVKSPVVVVAAVNGIAAGVGCSIALAADLAIAKESAGFMLAFTKIGLMPDGGASMLVPAAIGRARAARMALLAEKVSATTAAEWGLIAEVVADDDFAARVDGLVDPAGGRPAPGLRGHQAGAERRHTVPARGDPARRAGGAGSAAGQRGLRRGHGGVPAEAAGNLHRIVTHFVGRSGCGNA